MFEFLERHKKWLVYFPLSIYWLAMLIGTSIPTKSLPTFGVSDKFDHLFAYFGLTVLLNFAFIFQNKYPLFKQKHYLYSAIFAGIYGIIDELHQLFIPGRYCEFLDYVADVIGIILGLIIFKLILKLYSKKQQF